MEEQEGKNCWCGRVQFLLSEGRVWKNTRKQWEDVIWFREGGREREERNIKKFSLDRVRQILRNQSVWSWLNHKNFFILAFKKVHEHICKEPNFASVFTFNFASRNSCKFSIYCSEYYHSQPYLGIPNKACGSSQLCIGKSYHQCMGTLPAMHESYQLWCMLETSSQQCLGKFQAVLRKVSSSALKGS